MRPEWRSLPLQEKKIFNRPLCNSSLSSINIYIKQHLKHDLNLLLKPKKRFNAVIKGRILVQKGKP